MDTGSMFLEALPLLIPIVGILSGPLIMYIWFRHSARKNEEVQKTIRALIESGQPIAPELVQELTASHDGAKPRNRREQDLRWGIILVALSIGLMLFGVFDNAFERPFVNSQGVLIDRRMEEVMDMVGSASILLFVGLARLALWKWMPERKADSASGKDPASRRAAHS